MRIADRIAKVRNDAELSMEKFGGRLGISRAAVSQIEKGISNPAERTLKLICSEFRVNYLWLTTGEGEMYSNVGDTILNQLVEEYQLQTGDREIIERFLNLTPEQRAGIRAWVLGERK